MICKHCGKPLTKTFWEAVRSNAFGEWCVRCPDYNCPAAGNSFRVDDYEQIDIAPYVEYSIAYRERLHLGRITPRFTAAREALRAYVEQRNPKPESEAA